jgi:hypothetical protein
VDAEQAAAGAGTAGTADGAPFAPRFAADGIDELIMGFVGRNAKRGSWDGRVGMLAIHSDDGANATADWRVVAEPGHLAVARKTGPADCDVTGPAADLYLLLWNRRGTDGLGVRGDGSLLADFCRHAAVTWG